MSEWGGGTGGFLFYGASFPSSWNAMKRRFSTEDWDTKESKKDLNLKGPRFIVLKIATLLFPFFLFQVCLCRPQQERKKNPFKRKPRITSKHRELVFFSLSLFCRNDGGIKKTWTRDKRANKKILLGKIRSSFYSFFFSSWRVARKQEKKYKKELATDR